MTEKIRVVLELTKDSPSSMNFEDTYEGLADIRYKFERDDKGNIHLTANSDGFEHLARYFLKMARTQKNEGYHAHHSLDFDENREFPELIIGFSNKP